MQEILPPLPSPRGRYDGWTVARQEAFCAALAKGSTVQEACAIVGKSTTSAYKARDRIRGFSNRWNAGLEAAKPNIEAEVYRRAVEGWDEPVFHGGKQVGVRRRYSDALLKMLAQRGFTAPQTGCRPRMPIEEVERVLLWRLDRMGAKKSRDEEAAEAAARAAAAAEAERMRRAGLCP